MNLCFKVFEMFQKNSSDCMTNQWIDQPTEQTTERQTSILVIRVAIRLTVWIQSKLELYLPSVTPSSGH